MTDGIVCIKKEQDWTSFDVVAKCRRIIGNKKAGHGGTLDPMAEGVLPLFFGSATRAIDLAPVTNKRYRATFLLGMTTDTQDIWGKERTKQDVTIEEDTVRKALKAFEGDILQIPPMVSAVQVDGKRLYDLARKGVEVERRPRPVRVEEIRLSGYEKDHGTLDIHCSKGTYIRTIIADLGDALGCGAVMTSLVRTETLGFPLDDCITIGELERAKEEGRLDEYIRPVDSLFDVYPAYTLDSRQTYLYTNGVILDIGRLKDLPMGTPVRLYDRAHVFLGLAQGNAETKELDNIKHF